MWHEWHALVSEMVLGDPHKAEQEHEFFGDISVDGILGYLVA